MSGTVDCVGEKLDCEREIGRRIRLRDLHIFLTVSQRGSMAQAAAHLGVSQPAVSGVIADLERTLGVPLFERSTRGVKPTVYARAMLDRSVAAFDELKQGIRTLEQLADPTVGEIWIGCLESVSGSMLPPLLHQFMQRYPRVVVNLERMSSPSIEFSELCRRDLDVVLTRVSTLTIAQNDQVNIEPLFEDRLVVVAGARSPWARRRKLDLAELANEPWILMPSSCEANQTVAQAFRARGLGPPNVCLRTYSVPLRMNLAACGPYITVLPGSVRPLDISRSIRVLPLDLPSRPSALAIVTVKNRVLNPVAQRFIEHLRRAAAEHNRHWTDFLRSTS
jgi:DNA-binding transcriptional LysR family regulator